MTGSYYTSSFGTKLYFEKDGDCGPAVLYLHGFGASHESWNDIRPLLTATAQHYFLDLKGFGASAKPEDGRYAPEDHAVLIGEFVISNNLTDLTLVGHSYGGGVALLTYFRLATMRPSLLPNLVLIDSAGYPQKLPFFVAILRRPILSRLVLGLLPATLRARGTLQKIMFNKRAITPERIERYAKYFDVPGAHHAFINTARQILNSAPEELATRIPQIQTRVLLLWGREDPVIPLTLARRFEHELPAATLTILDNVGHVPQEEAPQDTAGLLNYFIEHP